MSKLLILVGIPGAGKSTFAAEYVATNPDAIIVGRDKLRELLFGFTEATVANYYKLPDFKEREQTVTIAQRGLIFLALQHGKAAIVDDTNCRWDRLSALMADFKAFPIEIKFFETPLGECLERNELRTRQVPTEAILSFYQSFLECKAAWEESKKPKQLDEKGFVFLDAKKDPYWIAMYCGTPWMFYWHPDKQWVTLRQVNQTEIWQAHDNALPADQAEHYHDLHNRPF